jgi:phage-related minor tail protein
MDHGNQSGADMKTRQEMIYDFMVALASNCDAIAKSVKEYNEENDATWTVAEEIALIATELADRYLKEGA